MNKEEIKLKLGGSIMGFVSVMIIKMFLNR